MIRRIALTGNPNSGKTTLFNQLTGTRQTTGNWPGVTVEKKEGMVRRTGGLLYVVDLPGIYSLSPYSMEEIITHNYITQEEPDVVVNIVDASQLERNLYLTLQLRRLNRPMVVALNMMDEVEDRGDRIDIRKLAEELKVPVVPVSAKSGQGLDDLIDVIMRVCYRDQPEQIDRYLAGRGPRRRRRGFGRRHPHSRPGWLGHVHHHLDHGAHPGFEQEENQLHEFHDYHAYHDHLRQVDHSGITSNKFEPESEQETVAMYREATRINSDTYEAGSRQQNNRTLTDRIDRILTHRVLAFPLFLLIMFLVFQLSFSDWLGGRGSDWLDGVFTGFGEGVAALLSSAGVAGWVESLLVDGIIAGVGGVLVFVPQLTLLFLFLTLLEDSGYMARAAFITDRIFQKLNLSGRSFIPMLLGFGCTVPAVMAARSLGSEKERRLTIMITPFMSCGARMPIYAFFAAAFFQRHQGLVSFSMYLIGIAVAVASAAVLSRTVFRGENTPFVIELPTYRLPSLRSLVLHVWDRVRGFVVKAGTIILSMSVVVWFLQSFSTSLKMVENNADSILAGLGRLLAPVFSLQGFGSWESAVALLTGLIAKESVVSTLEVLYTQEHFLDSFTPLTAYTFMMFTLLYMPCFAAFAAIRREMGSWRWALISAGYGTGVAYVLSMLVYQVGRLLV